MSACRLRRRPNMKSVLVYRIVFAGITLAQRRKRWPRITSALGRCIVLSGVSSSGGKPHQRNAAVSKHGTITQCCFNDRPASKAVGQH